MKPSVFVSQQRKQTRREVLKVMGLAAGAGSLGMWGCNGGPKDPPPPPPPPPPPGGSVLVRRNVMSADAASALEAYKKAVEVMMGRPESDPTSWQAQANVHLNWCPHSNAFFLPWHRAYLRYFEEICRAASGDANFALPYWDWTTHPSLPDAFWQAPLLDSTRSIEAGEPIPPQYVGQPVIDGILQITDFETFASAYVTDDCKSDPFQRSRCGSGELEAVPHNNTHNVIGGNMASYLSPLDPIFWLHHANVDRLWVEWNKNHANGDDETWRDFVFEQNFVDAAGQPQNVKVSDVFSTQALGYRYDTQPETATRSEGPPSTARVLMASEAANTGAAKAGKPLRIEVEIAPEMRERMQATVRRASATPSTLRLKVAGVATPSQALAVNLFVGGAAEPTSIDDPSFVGSFGFFPTAGEHAGHEGPTTFLFDIGDDLNQLGEGWNASQPLAIFLQPVPVVADAPPVTDEIKPTRVLLEVVENG